MSVFVILNHALTADQREELYDRFDEVVELTPEQRALWSQIPAEGDHLDVQKHIWEADLRGIQGPSGDGSP